MLGACWRAQCVWTWQRQGQQCPVLIPPSILTVSKESVWLIQKGCQEKVSSGVSGGIDLWSLMDKGSTEQ